MANRRWVQLSVDWLEWSQLNLVAAVRATDPVNLHRRAGPKAPSIAFHAWHMARWADRYQATLPTSLASTDIDGAREIWIRDDVVGSWGLRDIAWVTSAVPARVSTTRPQRRSLCRMRLRCSTT